MAKSKKKKPVKKKSKVTSDLFIAKNARTPYPVYQLFKKSEKFRKEELLLSEETLNRVWILRKLLSSLNPIDSLEFLLEKMRGTKNNESFLKSMNA